MEELKASNYLREFRCISVDVIPTTGKRPALPPYVDAVPMIMIEGEPKPFKDQAIWNWLSERRLKDTGTSTGNGVGGLDGFTGDGIGSGMGDETGAPMGEVWTGSKVSAMTDRIVGSMASIHDSAFGSMMTPDTPTSTGVGAGGVAPSTKPVSEKQREMDERMKAQMAARAEFSTPVGSMSGVPTGFTPQLTQPQQRYPPQQQAPQQQAPQQQAPQQRYPPQQAPQQQYPPQQQRYAPSQALPQQQQRYAPQAQAMPQQQQRYATTPQQWGPQQWGR